MIPLGFEGSEITPTRCRGLHLKQFCLEDIVPAVLIILITHIVLAVRWMLIKILSAVINDWEQIEVIVPGGYYLDIIIIRKNEQKSRCCGMTTAKGTKQILFLYLTRYVLILVFSCE